MAPSTPRPQSSSYPKFDPGNAAINLGGESDITAKEKSEESIIGAGMLCPSLSCSRERELVVAVDRERDRGGDASVIARLLSSRSLSLVPLRTTPSSHVSITSIARSVTRCGPWEDVLTDTLKTSRDATAPIQVPLHRHLQRARHPACRTYVAFS